MSTERSSLSAALAAIVAIVVALSAACSTAPEPEPPRDEASSPALPAGTAWRLTAYRSGGRSVCLDRAAMDAAGDGDAFSLALDGGRVGGLASCNRFFGEAAWDGPGGLSITGLGSTKMACLDDAYGLAEFEYLAALSAVGSWELAGGTLLLRGRLPDGSPVELAFSSPGR